MSQKANGVARFNLLPTYDAPSNGAGMHAPPMPPVGWGTSPPPLLPPQVFQTPSAGWSSVAPGGRPYLSSIACGQTPASSVLPTCPENQHVLHAHTLPRSSPPARDARASGAHLDALNWRDGTESAQLEELERREAAGRSEKPRSEGASSVAAGPKELAAGDKSSISMTNQAAVDAEMDKENETGVFPEGSSSLGVGKTRAGSRGVDEDDDGHGEEAGHKPLATRNPWKWSKAHLQEAADILATVKGKRKQLDLPDGGVLSGLNQAKRDELADAVEKVIQWKTSQGDTAPLRKIPAGFTPEKPVKRARAGKTGNEPDRRESFLILLCCHLANDSTFEGWIDCFTQKSRLSLEDKANSPKAKWYRDIARDMVNLDYKDDHGNPISFPFNYASDEPAPPDDLFGALDSVDLNRTKRELHALCGEDTAPLENKIGDWLSYLVSENTELLSKQDQSGGVGADEVDDGADTNGQGVDANGSKRRKDAFHAWHFCNGKLGVLLFNGILSLKGGGDVSHYGDIVIPDNRPGMGSSIQGGPGHRGMGGDEDLAATNEARASRRRAKLSEAAKRSVREDLKLEVLKGMAATYQAQCEAEAEDRREKTAPVVDIAAQLITASENVLAAKKAKDDLPEGCDPQVVACVELALGIRQKEMSDLMAKARSEESTP